MWHEEEYPSTRQLTSGQTRRRGDQARPAGETHERQAGEVSRCPYCRAVEDREHVCSLERLKRRILELEAENAHLRESALTFGDLAERLNKRMAEEANERQRPIKPPGTS